MQEPAISFYTEKHRNYAEELQSLTKILKRFAWFRFFAFISIFIPLFIFGLANWSILLISFFALILFIFLVKKNIELDKKRQNLIALKNFAENELLALEHSFLHFKDGKEFADIEHFFSYDLDLFGEGSLFQFLNRTATINGKHKLADWLIKPLVDKTEIEIRQDAVKELSLIPDWRMHFLANGNLFEETDEMSGEIISWSELELVLNNAKAVKWLIRIVPVLTVLSMIPAVLGITNLYLIVTVFMQWVLFYFFSKRITQYFGYFGRKSELLSKYMQLLQFIEKKEFKADYLVELQKKVRRPESASKIFSHLKSLVKELEYRQNIVVGIILNSFLLWDIRCVYKLWIWHCRNHKKLADWTDVIGEMDALISLANYAHNHPEYIFPKIREDGFMLKAKQMGHPLLHGKKRVCNDLEISGWSKVVLITGANMAGKSTFLRTVGVNLVLSGIGAPVCAEELSVTPIQIYTNMRTTDSLLKDESYFFAELRRIKGVLDRLEKGERIFVILDEMLKGTNSVDKLNGSRELIRRLINLKTVSLIATHDLKLSEMEEEFPQQVLNKCFEIKIENDELIFDYLLTDGATKTMNATFLMKKMGII